VTSPFTGNNPYVRMSCGHLARFAVENEDGAYCALCELRSAQEEITRLRGLLRLETDTEADDA